MAASLCEAAREAHLSPIAHDLPGAQKGNTGLIISNDISDSAHLAVPAQRKTDLYIVATLPTNDRISASDGRQFIFFYPRVEIRSA